VSIISSRKHVIPFWRKNASQEEEVGSHKKNKERRVLSFEASVFMTRGLFHLKMNGMTSTVVSKGDDTG
jgi:hypothetical protein